MVILTLLERLGPLRLSVLLLLPLVCLVAQSLLEAWMLVGVRLGSGLLVLEVKACQGMGLA